RGHNIHDSGPTLHKITVQILGIGDDPSAAFPVTLATMTFSILRASAVVRGNPQLPIFPIIFVTIFDGVPYPPYLVVHSFYGTVKLFTVPILMAHVVRIFQIYP